MTEPFTAADRRHLRDRLRAEGILTRDDTVRLVGPRGESIAWMFYSWRVSTTSSGLGLIGRALLDALQGFHGTQLAAHGYTAMPITTACVLLGEGRYTGLFVRSRPKSYGPRWMVEGRGDRDRSVVVVDDSLSSGTSFLTAARILEREGYEVEGLVALVDFSQRGGRERVDALGYRVVTVFDVWTDLAAPVPAPQPGHRHAMPGSWSPVRVPAALHPAVAARSVALHLVETGMVPLPPPSLAGEVDGRGGVFVSLRRRDDERLARSGFWHFDPDDAEPCRDLVLATAKAVGSLRRPLTPELLAELKIAVTFLGPLERVHPAELDFSRYGIVARSTAWPPKVGGALPDTQFFTSSHEQYRHARRVNARIGDLEPHELFRHEVVKFVEPGESWPAYGADARLTDGWTQQPRLGPRLLHRVRQVLAGSGVDRDALPADLVPASCVGVAVTLYSGGLLGHGLSASVPLDDAVVAATRAAGAAGDLDAATVCVTLLYDRERLGAAGITRKLRRGRDAFSVRHGERGGLFTESLVAHYDWTREQAAAELRRRAGVDHPDARWSTYKTASWAGMPDGTVRRLAYGYPARDRRLEPCDVELLATHLRRRLDEHGWPAYRVRPMTGVQERTGTAARCVHALRVLQDAGRLCDRPDWCDDAARGLRFALDHVDIERGGLDVPGHVGGPMAVACLLAAVDAPALRCAASDALAERLGRWVRADGSIRPPGVPPTRSEPDLLPGAVVLGLARHGAAAAIDTSAVLSFYRRRFRLVRPWGLAAWHAQAWAEVHRLGGKPEAAELVFELADWMTSRQLRVDGSYLVDLGTVVPGVLTAFAAEGVGAAWRLADELGDRERACRYGESWRAAMGFLDRLVVRSEDTYWMADPDAAVGGVRAALAAAELRVDHTSHALRALLFGIGADR